MKCIVPINHYPQMLLHTLLEAAPPNVDKLVIIVMTPGAYNSAYFEHAFRASQMGVELVEGKDLFVHADKVYMHTTEGPQQVHVIYRRVDDDFLDPLVFRADSTLGVPGLMRAYRSGGVALATQPTALYCHGMARRPCLHIPQMSGSRLDS